MCEGDVCVRVMWWHVIDWHLCEGDICVRVMCVCEDDV